MLLPLVDHVRAQASAWRESTLPRLGARSTPAFLSAGLSRWAKAMEGVRILESQPRGTLRRKADTETVGFAMLTERAL